MKWASYLNNAQGYAVNLSTQFSSVFIAGFDGVGAFFASLNSNTGLYQWYYR